MSQSELNPTQMGASTSFDQDIWDDTLRIIADQQISTLEIAENFALFLRRVNFAKFLTHLEIFKLTIGLPGSIVECGVFKGMSLLTFVKLVEVFCPGDSLKRVIGFDTFQGFV